MVKHNKPMMTNSLIYEAKPSSIKEEHYQDSPVSHNNSLNKL
jgi:hypothetical protein